MEVGDGHHDGGDHRHYNDDHLDDNDDANVSSFFSRLLKSYNPILNINKKKIIKYVLISRTRGISILVIV